MAWVTVLYVDLGKGNQLCKDQPAFQPLHVGCLGQLLHYADKQRRHRQHHGQVHGDGRVEEVRQLEEGGGIADCDEQEGGEEGHEGLLDEIQNVTKK